MFLKNNYKEVFIRLIYFCLILSFTGSIATWSYNLDDQEETPLYKAIEENCFEILQILAQTNTTQQREQLLWLRSNNEPIRKLHQV